VSAALVGPLPVITFADGTRQAYTPPRNTMDIRYAVCSDHHPGCDCREALLAEDIGEYRMMLRDVEQAILAAIKGHQTYAYTGQSDTGWSAEDEFGQCKCPACVIARAAHIGFGECMQQRREASDRAAAEARERDRAHYARICPDLDEVPF
jgi:hypothetical protein